MLERQGNKPLLHANILLPYDLVVSYMHSFLSVAV